MRLLVLIFLGVAAAAAQTAPISAPSTPAGNAQFVDGVAVRIDTDVITESEVRELADFQRLVDGSARPRDEVIRELCDQWILHGEAETARFPHPTDGDVDNAYQALVKQFPSPEEFQKRRTAAQLTDSEVREQLSQQLYLSRFIDFRFRPAAEVDDAAVQKYYDEEFAPQLKAKGEPVPALDKVQETIREVLVLRLVNDRANQWLDDTRGRLEIDVVPQGGSQ
jgi:hypothetical protein